MKLSVSYLKSKYDLKETINKINDTDADYIHVDVMDGIFVDNTTYSISDIASALRNNKKKLDIHFMVADPISYINKYLILKPEYITIHVETNHLKEAIQLIKDNNIKVGLALNPDTPVYEVIPYLKDIDLLLVMGVKPGYGGQSFIENTYKRLKELKAIQPKYNYIISVDGGINKDTAKKVDTDMIVSGSYICESDDITSKVNELKNI